MSDDWYSDFVNSAVGKTIAGNVGLPRCRAAPLEPGQPLLSGAALLGTATANGRVAKVVRAVLSEAGVEVHEDPPPRSAAARRRRRSPRRSSTPPGCRRRPTSPRSRAS